ncbi:hypothetical protein E8E11_011902 [Didymella keratinophila]|nr:hypothetical protein E8E11_011902 [Didymella keratinophila]
MNDLHPCLEPPPRGKYRDTDHVPMGAKCTRGIQPDGRIASSFTERTLMQLMVALHATQTSFVRRLTSHETKGIEAVVGLTEHTVTGSPDKEFHFRLAVRQRRKGIA